MDYGDGKLQGPKNQGLEAHQPRRPFTLDRSNSQCGGRDSCGCKWSGDLIRTLRPQKQTSSTLTGSTGVVILTGPSFRQGAWRRREVLRSSGLASSHPPCRLLPPVNITATDGS